MSAPDPTRGESISKDTGTFVADADRPTDSHHPPAGDKSTWDFLKDALGQMSGSTRDTASTRDGSEAATVVPGELPVIPGYEVAAEVARGGMGVVYRARHEKLNRLTALKMVLAGRYQDPVARVRFLVEAEAVAQIDHPHVVAVHEFGTHDGLPYLAMEYVSGGTLAGKVSREGRFPPRAAAEMVAKLADGVAAAHAKGIVHRDLKPANVLLTEAGEPKIADFGLARIGDARMTASGAVMGTPSYMAPEQAGGRAREIGTPTDVYSLGAILYELLTARPPFIGDTAMATIQQVLHRDPERPRTVVANIPRDLETICLKCLEKDPAKRYATAAALRQDLVAYLDGRPITARPVGLIERSWKWAKRRPTQAAALAAAVSIALAATVGMNEVRKQREADQRAADERTRQAERQTKADALVDSLVTADSSEVPGILTQLADVRELVRPKLERLAGEPIDTRGGFRGRLALIERGDNGSPFVLEMNEYIPRCRVEDLTVVYQYAQSLQGDAHKIFWLVLAKSPEPKPDALLKTATILARLSPDDPRWADLGPMVAAPLVRVNPLEADVFARALDPVRGVLVPELLKRYPELQRRIEAGNLPVSELVAEASAFDLTASLLARYTTDRPAELAELAVIADARHHKLIAASLATNKAAAVPVLKAELTKKPIHTWEPAKTEDSADGPVACVVGATVERGTTIPDAVRVALAKRQANAAAVLFTLGEAEAVWPLLKLTPDPTVRSFFIARLAGIGADPMTLVRRFAAEPDPSAKRAVLLAMGDFPFDLIPAAERGKLTADLLKLYRTDPDPGLHSAIDWVLRQKWGKSKEIAAIDDELKAAAVKRAEPARAHWALPSVFGAAAVLPPPPALPPQPGTAGWFVNGSGQTFAVVRGPVEFGMGGAPTEPGRNLNEPSYRKRITRTYAIATKEVTTAEYQRFNPKHDWLKQYGPDPDGPAITMTWYDVAKYCNWLSAQEGIPPDQWCYEPNPQGEYAEGMVIRAGHLTLNGYRMPTEAEWEYASRAGTVTARFCGRADEQLGRYAWHQKNTDTRSFPVGRLRPNDLGLFDMLGNALDRCVDLVGGPNPFEPDDDGNADPVTVVDNEMRTTNGRSVRVQVSRVLKGGSFAVPVGFVRSGSRTPFAPSNRNVSSGIRLARTWP
jgi:formylglycine-generating enzyme required for sulfatase activity/tRNA A-37 threonylcarbamoyl transferase component Bud32